MNLKSLRIAPLAALAAVVLACPAFGEITSISGAAFAEVREINIAGAGDEDRVTESFPGTSATLPLQVVAELFVTDEAAAAVAAQFADPRTLLQPNPEEFAINLALNSLSESVHYEANAYASETREVVFSAAEIPFAQPGGQAKVLGRLFIDGALTIFATDPNHDLTGANVRLLVTVRRTGGSLPNETVFAGEVGLRGGANGDATTESQGSFPTARLIKSNLALFVTDFAAFHALIIPNLSIDYEYDVIVDEPFTLEARVQVLASNVPDASGVAAVIGTPVTAIQQVLALTEGAQVASKTLTALADERANPTGQPAFPGQSLFPILPFCGAVGFEALLGLGLLAGLKCYGPRRII